jgi:hypothetical protein
MAGTTIVGHRGSTAADVEGERTLPGRSAAVALFVRRRAQSGSPAASRLPPLLDLLRVRVPAARKSPRWQSFTLDPGKQHTASVERVRLQTQMIRDLFQTLQHPA